MTAEEITKLVGASLGEARLRGYELPEAVEHVADTMAQHGLDAGAFAEAELRATE